MAKFCGKCGATLADDALVCGFCGERCDDASSGATPSGYTPPEERQKKTKLIMSIGIGLAILIVLIVVINIVLSNTGYKGAVKKIFNAYKNDNVDALVDMSSMIYFSMDYDDDDDLEYYFEYKLSETLDNFEDSIGSSYKLSYEITDQYELSNRKYEQIMEELEYYFDDIDDSEIDSIRLVKVKMTAKRGERSKSETINIYLSKEKGGWKLLYLD